MLKDNQINTYSLFMIVNIIFAFVYEMPDTKIIFLTTIMVILISMQHIFKEDYKNGILEQIFLYQNLYLAITKLAILHWLKHGLTVVLFAVIIMFANEVEEPILIMHFISLAYVSFIITFTGIIGESATIEEKTNTKAIIINLPLLIPTLVFHGLLTNDTQNTMLVVIFILLTLISAIMSIIISALNIKIAIQCK